jgi:uncharacterized protein
MNEPSAGESRRPWYRQRWPWLVMLPPFASVVAGFTLLFHALNSPNPLVVDDYASIVRHTEKRFERDREAARLGLAGRVSITAEAAGTEIVLGLEPVPGDPGPLRLRFVHPTLESLDRETALLPEGAGRWSGQLPEQLQGRYYLQLEPAARSWRLACEWRGEATLALAPPAEVLADPADHVR